MTYVIMMLI